MECKYMNYRIDRVVYIDIIRLLACFFVILTHSAMPSVDGSDGFIKAGISFVSIPFTDLFFAVSGALLLPTHGTMKEFYKKRFLKLLPPVVIWSVVTLLVRAIIGKITINEALFSFIKMPFEPVIGVYWFIYVIIGLYLLAPIISPWIQKASKKQIEFFLFLWAINLILPYLNALTPPLLQIGLDSHSWMMSYFGGYIGYFLLGYYLHQYPIIIGKNVRWLATVLGAVGYCIFPAIFLANGQGVEFLFDNLHLGIAIMVVFVTTIIQHVSKYLWVKNKANSFSIMAKYTFGIYLIHILVVRDFVWNIFVDYRMSAIPETFIIAILTMAICYTILIALSYLPKSKYIIGC